MNRRHLASVTLGAAALLSIVGCASTEQLGQADPREHLLAGSVPLEEYQAAPPLRVATLGAGDALGRAIHVQDIILAAIEEVRRREAETARPLATVPTD